MTTLAIMKARIVSEIFDRTDIDAAIAREITSAIAFYQTKRLFFNEKRDITFPTVIAQSDYAAAASAYIPDLLGIDSITSIYSGAVLPIKMTDQETIDRWISSNSAATNFPCWYSYYQRKLRLYPVPNAVYTVRLAGHVKIAAPATDGEADNPWMIEAEELIRSRAKRNIYVHYLADTQMGQVMKMAEDEAFADLKATSSKMANVSVIEPWTI